MATKAQHMEMTIPPCYDKAFSTLEGQG